MKPAEKKECVDAMILLAFLGCRLDLKTLFYPEF